MLRKVGGMKKNRSASRSTERRTVAVNVRNVAAHHAIGFEPEISQAKKRLFELAVNEAEALACQTGVPELVMLTLAEEKVRQTRQWLARQDELKSRSNQWQLAA